MIVTKMDCCGKDKYKIYLDFEYAFILYKSDINKYHLQEEREIDHDTYYEIIEETVFRRAKKKALDILKRMDRTEYELRQKLKQAFYTEEIIQRTIEYVNSYHYLDDKRYVQNYISYHSSIKSRQQIVMELKRKGISGDELKQMEENKLDDAVAIKKVIQKKMKNREELNREEKQKIATYLYRKGFKSDDIKKYLDL